MEVVYEGGLCFSCLRKGHWTRSCRSSRKCGVKGCKLTHHPLLHRSSGQAKPDQRNSREEDSSSGLSTAAAPQHQSKGTGSSPFVAASLSEETDTLLQVVQVRVHGATKSKDVLALLDTGAQTSLCSDDVLQELGIAGDPRQLCIQHVEGSGAMKPSERVTLTVSALGDDVKGGYIEIPEVWAVPSLNVTAPTVTQRQLKQCEHLRGLKFPQYDGGDVKLLLGGNVLEAVLQREVRVGRSNQPAAVRTEFGWALAGSISAVVPSSLRQVMFLQRNAQCRDDDLTATVKDWWSTEAFGTKYDKPVTQSREDERALSILKSKTRRLPDRYETGMLWKEDQVVFPDNKRMAVKRLEATERKLKRNPDLAGAYQETLQTYIQEGHARKLTPEETSQHRGRRWFLPHHAVTNPNKPGKVRVVFDATAKFQGTSLNDKLLTGPDLLKSLPGVLLRFREEPIALTADIEKMYHQVRVTEEDQPSLSFLWRDLDTSRPPDVYQMQVVVFGAKSSPAMANYVLQKTAQAHQERATPESEAQAAAVGAVFTNFYMDDFLKSERTPQAAMKMQRELSKLLASGGFRLTKWLSNSREVLESIPSSERARGSTDLGLQHLPAEKTLGVIWDSEKDTLSFQVTNTEAQATKREVLRQTASVFDPLGIGAPFIIRAKILLQHLWTLNLDWDQALPDHEDGRWRQWLAEPQRLKEVVVPRCLKPVEGEAVSSQFHVFCDASEAAFGAVIYLRTSLTNGEHHCSLVMSKTRVAPLKQMSIVRLELQAAVLAARLMDTVLKEATVAVDAVTFWSDSKVVLQYIANESRRFHVFVANRVAEIHDLTRKEQWRHVPGTLNPADDCSRGLAASDLAPDCRWLRGPGFLWQDEENWPPKQDTGPLRPRQEEVKEEKFAGLTLQRQPVLPDATKFSCWLKYRRVAAWVRRFTHNTAICASGAGTRFSGPLSAQELRDAEVWILKQVQRASYPEETHSLALGKELPGKSGLLPLSPYRDDDGLMRVGGRLGNAPVPEDARHPIILPPRGEITRLVILQKHEKCGHAGVAQTLNETREKYWVVRGRTAVKQLLQWCPTCRRLRALPRPPRMASLPAARFDTARPFSSTGVDMFGPLYVKRFRRTEKRYGLLATCMATRAIHLEVVHSLDTASCIMALRRFFARRGKPSVIFSDNGTNFVGSCRELKAELRAMEREIAENLSAFEVDWHFNPPAASHMGGVWERLIRSVKKTLKVVVGPQTLTDEVLVTVLTEVEHMINSRPLTHVSSEPTDPEALTPNHFLLGGASRHLAPGLVKDRDMCSRRRWKHAQAVAEHVWKRWTREYVPTLIQRSKWRKEQRNLQVGDLVLMAESNMSRGSWPLARIRRVFPSADGRVRSAELQTASGKLYTRPATKICFLEEECK